MDLELSLNNQGLTNIVEVHASKTNLVLKAVRSGSDVAVKIFSAAGSGFASELELLRLLPSRNVNTPPMVDSFKMGNDNVIVYEWWHAIPLQDAAHKMSAVQLTACLADAGVLLAAIAHSLDADDIAACSFWHRPGFTLRNEYSWNGYLNALVVKWRNRIVYTDRDLAAGLPGIVDYVARYCDTISEPARICLFHCDYGYRNLLVDPERYKLRGVIDFELEMIGDPLYDVAGLSYRIAGEPSLRSAFVEGWQSSIGQQVDHRHLLIYEAVKAISALAWVDKQGELAIEHKDFRNAAAAYLASVKL